VPSATQPRPWQTSPQTPGISPPQVTRVWRRNPPLNGAHYAGYAADSLTSSSECVHHVIQTSCCDHARPLSRQFLQTHPVNRVRPILISQGGESQADVERRVAAFVEGKVLPRLEAGGPPAVVVAHGLAIKWCGRGIWAREPPALREGWAGCVSGCMSAIVGDENF
jgi:hypothetical protein